MGGGGSLFPRDVAAAVISRAPDGNHLKLEQREKSAWIFVSTLSWSVCPSDWIERSVAAGLAFPGPQCGVTGDFFNGFTVRVVPGFSLGAQSPLMVMNNGSSRFAGGCCRSLVGYPRPSRSLPAQWLQHISAPVRHLFRSAPWSRCFTCTRKQLTSTSLAPRMEVLWRGWSLSE